MAKKQVYAKGANGVSDFIYVDLLPEVKRPRQFNMNVIFILTFTLVAAFIIIYLPYRTRTAEFEELNGLNNDYKHELLLTQEEFEGYQIDLDTIAFGEDIDYLLSLQTDFNNMLDDIELTVDEYDGTITSISYSAQTNRFTVDVEMTSYYKFNNLGNEFLNLSWVTDSEFEEPRLVTTVLYTSSYTLEVNSDVE